LRVRLAPAAMRASICRAACCECDAEYVDPRAGASRDMSCLFTVMPMCGVLFLIFLGRGEFVVLS
jgi:hypothetical protein